MGVSTEVSQRAADLRAAKNCRRYCELLAERFYSIRVNIPDHEAETIKRVLKRSEDFEMGKLHVKL